MTVGDDEVTPAPETHACRYCGAVATRRLVWADAVIGIYACEKCSKGVPHVGDNPLEKISNYRKKISDL